LFFISSTRACVSKPGRVPTDPAAEASSASSSSTSSSSSDFHTPADAARLRVPLEPGDLVLLATDGLFDNVESADILRAAVDAMAEDDARADEGGSGDDTGSNGMFLMVAMNSVACFCFFI
jgi:hypothetical protein